MESPSDSTLALCLRIICTGENAVDKSRFPVTDTFMIFHDGSSLWWAPEGQACI